MHGWFFMPLATNSYAMKNTLPVFSAAFALTPMTWSPFRHPPSSSFFFFFFFFFFCCCLPRPFHVISPVLRALTGFNSCGRYGAAGMPLGALIAGRGTLFTLLKMVIPLLYATLYARARQLPYVVIRVRLESWRVQPCILCHVESTGTTKASNAMQSNAKLQYDDDVCDVAGTSVQPAW